MSCFDSCPLPEKAAELVDLDSFRLNAPSGAALVTWPGTDRYTLMKTLFWNPTISRVLVLGGGRASDGSGSDPAVFARAGIVDDTGHSMSGPFAFGPDTTVFSADFGFSPGDQHGGWLRGSPGAIVLGLDREDGYLSTVAEMFISPQPGRSVVELRLKADTRGRRLTFICSSGRTDVDVWKALEGCADSHRPQCGHRACRVSLTRGAAFSQEAESQAAFGC